MTGTGTADNLPYAPVGKRLKAFLFDYAIIFGYMAILGGVNYGIILSGGVLEDVSPFFTSPWAQDGFAFLTLVLPVILYFTFMESSSRQATWGKGKVDLLVVGANGEAMTVRQAFFRNLLKFLPWQIAHTSIYHVEGWPAAPETPTPLVMAGFVLVWVMIAAYLASMLFTKSHRTLYDRATGTCVVDAA